MMKPRQVILLATLMLSSCSGAALKPDLAAFCAAGSEADEKQRLYFDLEKRIAFGGDVTSSLGPLQTGDYVGFIFPFPIMVPSEELLRSGERLEWEVNGDSQWEADRYSFVSEPEERPEPAWFLITATQEDDPDIDDVAATHDTTVLYSLEAGVISIRRTTTSPDLNVVDEYYHCSQQKLDPLDMTPDAS
ncbi:MAG: hypothetical protein AAF543_07905 [Pseudomonadota bacterium]